MDRCTARAKLVRRVRATSALGVTLALCLATAALAQDDDPSAQEDTTSIVGSGSFNTAPPIEPGVTYSDTIIGGETLVYRFRLEPGQSATVNAVSTDPELFEAADIFQFGPLLYTPMREVADSDLAGDPGEPVTAGIQSPLPGLDEAAGGSGEYIGPGEWYVGVTATGGESRVAVPFTFTVAVEGEPAPQTPPPEDGGEEAQPEQPAAAQEEDTADDSGVATLIGVLLGGLLLGGAAGGVAGLFRRREQAG